MEVHGVNEGGVAEARMNTEDHPDHPQTLEPQTPMIITQVMYLLGHLVSSYGWPCLLLGVVCGLLWSRYSPAVDRWKRKREEQKEAELHCKNPDLHLAREAAVESARLRLQERYEEDSRDHAEKTRQREEQRRMERLAAAEAKIPQPQRAASTTSQTARAEKKRPSAYRPEYNPLMGGSGSGYRPSRRGGAAGGG